MWKSTMRVRWGCWELELNIVRFWLGWLIGLVDRVG